MRDDAPARRDVSSGSAESVDGDRNRNRSRRTSDDRDDREPDGDTAVSVLDYAAESDRISRRNDERGPPGRTDRAVRSRRGTGEGDAFTRWCAETNARLAAAETARIVVYVRSLLPSPGAKQAQTSVFDDLSSLCDRTPVEETAIEVWGERLCLCDTCRNSETGGDILETVREFESWGEDYDATAAPFFERTSRHSTMVGETHEGVVPPRVTAALYVDDSLQGVFPSRFGDQPRSVRDLYEGLRTVAESDTAAE